jgi:hypothetical protein
MYHVLILILVFTKNSLSENDDLLEEPATSQLYYQCSTNIDCNSETFCKQSYFCNTSSGDCVQYPENITINPCETDSQLERTPGEQILICSSSNSSCSTIQCLSDSDCEDGNFCNGEEICDNITQTCVFPDISSCPSNTFCDNTTMYCIECTSDTDCTLDNPCDGIGICNTLYNTCIIIIPRCDPIIEVCDNTIDLTEISPLFSINYERVYCVQQNCNSPSDCSTIGTLCIPYNSTNGEAKKCTKCTNDAQCQDGILCNGNELCHPEGTCRRALYPLCYNVSINITFPCDEKTGSCDKTISDESVFSDKVKDSIVVSQPTKPVDEIKSSNSNKIEPVVVSESLTKDITINRNVKISYLPYSNPMLGVYQDPNSPVPAGDIALFITLPLVMILLSILFCIIMAIGLTSSLNKRKTHRRKKYR